jgi:hypothetical protein
MRRLTFEGFLGSYVKYLSGEDTLALPRLVRLLPTEPRLVEPLVLWAAATGRGDRLARLLEDDRAAASEVGLVEKFASEGRLEQVLDSGDPALRPEYAKAWRSYVARRDAPARDARLKLDARARVLALKAEKSVSQYRMAKDLGLNPGNLNAFLVQGDPRKLGLDKVFALVRYLEAS